MMAAARRTTRQQQRGKRTGGSEPGESKSEEQVVAEVIDLCNDDSDMDDKVEATQPENDNSATTGDNFFQFQEEPESGFLTFFDFESDDSIPNATVKSFLQDCLKQPKILCHKSFRPFRNFISEVMDFVFELPQDAPYLLDHEDNKFCVDKGDKWLVDLKVRVKRLYPVQQNGSDDSDEDDDDTPPPYYWANITPVQRKSDLGLIIFAWTPLPMTLPILDVYLAWSKAKYVPPKPPSPPPKPLRSSRKKRVITPRRRTRAFSKQNEIVSEHKEEAVVEKEESLLTLPTEVTGDDTKPVEGHDQGESNVDNGVDDYIKDFTKLFKICRGMDAEERLKGDYETKARWKLENKEEPKYSRELVELIRRNRHINTPVQIISRKPQTVNGHQKGNYSDSESESTSTTSVESACSEYRGKYVAKGNKRTHKKRKPTETRPTVKTPPRSKSATAVTNGVGKRINGTIKSSKKGLRTSFTSPAVKKKSMAKTVTCDACRPAKVFQSRKALYKHLTAKHAPRNRILTLCKCGINIRKERLEFHKRYCKKAIISDNNKHNEKS